MAAVTQCGSKHLVDSSKEEYVSELLVPSGADNENTGEEQFAKHARITAEVPPSGDMVCLSPPAVPWRKDSAIIDTSVPFRVWLRKEMSSSGKLPPSEKPPSVLQRVIIRKPDGSTRTLTFRRELPVY